MMRSVPAGRGPAGGRGAVQRLLRPRRLPAPLARGCRVREAGRGGGAGAPRSAPHGGGRAGPAGEASAGPGGVPAAAGRARRPPGPRARRPPPPGAAAAPPRPHHLRGAAAAGAPAPLRAGGGGSVVRPVLPLRALAGPALCR